MSRRSRRSRRKLNSLFMTLLLTGMLLLTSTYAWFSANKEVALEGINAKVVAAEGLQISLDGESWSSKITINATTLGQAVANKYRWPTALTPVSTVGATSSGNMNLFYGDVNAEATELNNTAAESDADTTKYIVFDLYFKNSSSQVDGDILQLNAGSSVAIAADGKQNTGLENSIRSAVVLYENKANMTDDGATIRAIAAGTPTVCIWEPNYNKHISEVVKNDSRIPADNTVFTTLGLKATGGGTVTGINAANLDTPNENLGEQKTLQTDGSVTGAVNMTNLGGNDMKLAQNAVMKARVYIWLEGQDPDCIDTASTGKSIDIVIGFTKPEVKDGP